MFKRIAASSLAVVIAASSADAFDPFTVAMGSQALGGMMGGMGDGDSLLDAGFALGDLLSELDVETGSEGEVQKALGRIDELNSKARELEWNRNDIKQALEVDLQRTENLAIKIKALKTMIAASKKIAVIMGIRPKAGEKAVHIQQIKINSMILDELQGMRRDQFLALLERRESDTKREIYIQQILDKENKQNSKLLSNRRSL